MAPSDDDIEDEQDLSRWQLPLRPLSKPMSGAVTPPPAKPALPPITLDRGAVQAPTPQADLPVTTDESYDHDPSRTMEAPDVTARFVVAQLGALNERLSALTEVTAERTTDALVEVRSEIAEVRHELARLTSLREYDLTEQAAGIFAAVDAGATALDRFSVVVGQVTDDLRQILADALGTIGGTGGLAEAVVQGATDLAETRSELVAGIGRIQRDLATLRKRIPIQKKTSAVAPAAVTNSELSDEQVAYIVEAVTESVVAALVNPARPSRRKTGA